MQATFKETVEIPLQAPLHFVETLSSCGKLSREARLTIRTGPVNLRYLSPDLDRSFVLLHDYSIAELEAIRSIVRALPRIIKPNSNTPLNSISLPTSC